MARRGDEFLIPVSAENRASAGVVAGDELDVDIEVDSGPREVSVPTDFAAPLGDNPDAKRFFYGQSSSQQQWFDLERAMFYSGTPTAR